MLARNFDAILFDAGGIFLLPDPTVLGPLLAYHGGDTAISIHLRAHYAGMAAKSAAGKLEHDWDDYNDAYVRIVGVPDHEADFASMVLGRTRNAYTWRWAIPESVAALAALVAAGVPVGVVSNASGQIAELLWRDPHIFDFALEHFPGIERSRIAYVGDSVTMDIGGARAAGLHPILLDPYDDHPEADFQRIHSLAELLQ